MCVGSSIHRKKVQTRKFQGEEKCSGQEYYLVVLTNTCLETEVSSFLTSNRLQDLLLLFLVLWKQDSVDIWQDPSSRNDRVAEHLAKFLVVPDGKHQVARIDRLSLVVSARVSCKFNDLRHEIFQNGSHEDSSSRRTAFAVIPFAEVARHSSNGERQTGS